MGIAALKVKTILPGILLLMAAVTGCGNGHPQTIPTVVAGATQNSSRPSSASSVPKSFSPAYRLDSLVGKPLFGLDDSNAACQAALDGTQPPALPVPGGSGLGDNPATNTSSATAVGSGTLVPGGLLVLSCAPNGNSTVFTLVAFNLFTRTVSWQFSLAGYDTYMFGTNHLFLISHQTTSPTGLQASKTTYTLTAVDVRKGTESWSAPYFADTKENDDTQIANLTEGPSGYLGHPQDVVVSYLGTSAYDVQTGANLWHIPEEYGTQANGFYALDGIVEVYDSQSNGADEIIGFNARTYKRMWVLRFPRACPESAGSQDDVFNGLVEWQFSDTCSEAHNVATGKLVAERIYPSSWRSVMATPTTVLEYSHSKLSLFKMSDFAHPVWSEKAGPTTPLAMSSGHALVEAPSGMLVLSITDGSITSSVPSVFSVSSSYSIVDGLIAQGTIDGRTNVLELDPPHVYDP